MIKSIKKRKKKKYWHRISLPRKSACQVLVGESTTLKDCRNINITWFRQSPPKL